MKNTGMAVTIDIGEADNIHPRNKQDVGKRLAQWALAKTYGKDVVASGPLYKSSRQEAGKIVVEFNYADGGLASRDGGKLIGFAIAGADKKFVWADAQIVGDTVVVSSPLSRRRSQSATPGRTTRPATWSTRRACPPRPSAPTTGSSPFSSRSRPMTTDCQSPQVHGVRRRDRRLDHRSQACLGRQRPTSPRATRSRWPTSAWARRGSARSAACWPIPRYRLSPSATRTPRATTTWNGARTASATRYGRYLGKPAWRESDSGCPGGREVGREVVDAYYANQQRGARSFKACRAYADFRELLDKEKDLDAVKIMTPDHLHATIAIAAMKKGKHVLVHKPLANRMHEGRLVVETARQTKVATHLLAYGAGAGNAADCRADQGGGHRPACGKSTTGRTGRCGRNTRRFPADRPPVPKGFDWDLWLGPALDRPYHPHYTHTVFRGWYDFGGGSMADMGIYSLWPVFTALDLGVPQSAEAWATHTCSIIDNVSRADTERFLLPDRLHHSLQVRRPGRIGPRWICSGTTAA